MGVFTWEVLLDMTIYGFWAAALCLCSFSLVVFGFGDGNLGSGCNDSIHKWLSTRFPRQSNNIYLSNVVRIIPRLGNDQHASIFFPNATRFKILSNSMDSRCLEKSISLLEYFCWICYCFSYYLCSRYQHGCV